MAKAAVEPGERLDDAADRSQSPVVSVSRFATLCAAVADYLRETRPDATECEFIVRSPHGDRQLKTTFEIPLTAFEPSIEEKIMGVLSRLRPGAWMKGAAIAVEIGSEYGGGSFGGIMSKLSRDDGPLESGRNGYRLRPR